MLCKEKEQGMLYAEWVLVEQHRVRTLTELTFTILVIFLIVLHLLLSDHFLVLKINVEQDLSLIFLQQICVRATALEDLKRSVVELPLKQVVGCVIVIGSATDTAFIISTALTEEYSWGITLAFINEEPVDVL